MKEIALRYGDERLTSLVFDENSTNQKLFETVKCTDLLLNKTEESGILLNGRKFNHILYCHKDIEVIISSDEIYHSEILDFLQNFWIGRFKYIAIQKDSIWGNYEQVMTETGRFPITYIDEIRDLPEVALNLSYVNPL
ncbi:hypothetical protein MASR1M45_28130 [Candidatus Kapaibacterium sp.]